MRNLTVSSRTALVRMLADGIALMFQQPSTYLRPGIEHRRVNGRWKPKDPQVLTPINTDTVQSVRVRYQVETGPNAGQAHAHIFVEVRMRARGNCMLRKFHPHRWTRENPAWWTNFFPALPVPNTPLAGNGAWNLRRTDGTVATVDVNAFGWHVKGVRPQDPGGDVISYLTKTFQPKPKGTRSRRRQPLPDPPQTTVEAEGGLE
jgi:hypothetical protein